MGTGACAVAVTFDSKSVDGFKWNGVERSKASEIKDKKRSDRPIWKKSALFEVARIPHGRLRLRADL